MGLAACVSVLLQALPFEPPLVHGMQVVQQQCTFHPLPEAVHAAVNACRAASQGPLPTRPPISPLRPAESLLEAASATLQALHSLDPQADVLDTVLLLAQHAQLAREAVALLECCSAVASTADHAALLLAPTCPLWRVLYVQCASFGACHRIDTQAPAWLVRSTQTPLPPTHDAPDHQ